MPTCNPSTEHPCSASSWEIKAFLCAHPQSIILPAPQGPLTSSWHLQWSLPPAAGMQPLCPAPAGLIWDHLVPKTLSPVLYIPAQRQWVQSQRGISSIPAGPGTHGCHLPVEVTPCWVQ